MKFGLIHILALEITLASAGSVAAADASATRSYKDREFTEFFRRTNGWTSGDGAFSVPLSDGRVLWLFGDSHIDDLDPKTETTPCLFQVRNAGLIQDTNGLRSAQTLIGSGPGSRTWFKNSTNSHEWFWPVCGFQEDKSVYIYLAALESTGKGGMWGFKARSHDYFAKAKFPELTPFTYVPLANFNGIGFGQGFVKAGEFIYAYGQKQKGVASDVFVARFKSTAPERDWEFWDGTRWSENVTNAVPIAHGTSTSVHICKIDEQFLLTTTAFSVACDQGKEIFMATSKNPIGPFSPLKSVYRLDDLYEGHYPFFYLAVAHPEFINDKNELLVTYSINGYEPCVKACIEGRAIADHYRPKAIRVPLGEIRNSNRESRNKFELNKR
jgi:Domain of unknown function (DUF5005)